MENSRGEFPPEGTLRSVRSAFREIKTCKQQTRCRMFRHRIKKDRRDSILHRGTKRSLFSSSFDFVPRNKVSGCAQSTSLSRRKVARLECAVIKGKVDGLNNASTKTGGGGSEMTDDYRLKSDRRCRVAFINETRGDLSLDSGLRAVCPRVTNSIMSIDDAARPNGPIISWIFVQLYRTW